WEGNVNGNWNTNTANWKDSATSASVTYLQNSIPGEPAVFNDAATGTRTVVLTTNLGPNGIYMTNSTAPYFFTGSGRLTGPTSLNKNGSSTLVLTNSGLNDFGGGVNINAGTLRLGLTP